MAKIILATIAAALIIGTLVSKNFGFVPITGAQSIGFNMWALLVYIGGSWLIYRAFKRDNIQSKPVSRNLIFISKECRNIIIAVFTIGDWKNEQWFINQI